MRDRDILRELSVESLWLQSLEREGSCLSSLRVTRGSCLLGESPSRLCRLSFSVEGRSMAFTFSKASASTFQSMTDVTRPDRRSRGHVIYNMGET